MLDFEKWQKWLVVVSWLVTIFGVFLALANSSPIFQIFNHQVDPIFWYGGTLPDEAVAFRTWVYGAWGGTVAGWGIFMIYLTSRPFKDKQPWSWWCMVAGLAIWFLLDSGLSWRAGVMFNVIFNAVLLLAAGLPLAFTAPVFLKAEKPD